MPDMVVNIWADAEACAYGDAREQGTGARTTFGARRGNQLPFKQKSSHRPVAWQRMLTALKPSHIDNSREQVKASEVKRGGNPETETR